MLAIENSPFVVTDAVTFDVVAVYIRIVSFVPVFDSFFVGTFREAVENDPVDDVSLPLKDGVVIVGSVVVSALCCVENPPEAICMLTVTTEGAAEAGEPIDATTPPTMMTRPKQRQSRDLITPTDSVLPQGRTRRRLR